MITIWEAPSWVCEKVLFEGCQSVEICNLLPQIAHLPTNCTFTPKGVLRKLPAFVHKLNEKRAEVCEKLTVHCHLLVTATSHFLAQSPLHHQPLASARCFLHQPGHYSNSEEENRCSKCTYFDYKMHSFILTYTVQTNAHKNIDIHTRAKFSIEMSLAEDRPSGKIQAGRGCSPVSYHWKEAVLLHRLHPGHSSLFCCLDRSIFTGP